MASGLYAKTKKLILDADLDLLAGSTLKAVLIDTADYTVNLATHDFYDDASVGAVGTPVALANKTTTDGVLDADDTVLVAVTGDPCEAILIFNDTGVPGTSALVAYIDGITVTPNGGNITIVWDSGANKIFKIG